MLDASAGSGWSSTCASARNPSCKLEEPVRIVSSSWKVALSALVELAYYVPGCGDLSGSIGVERAEVSAIADDRKAEAVRLPPPPSNLRALLKVLWQARAAIGKAPRPAATTRPVEI